MEVWEKEFRDTLDNKSEEELFVLRDYYLRKSTTVNNDFIKAEIISGILQEY